MLDLNTSVKHLMTFHCSSLINTPMSTIQQWKTLKCCKKEKVWNRPCLCNKLSCEIRWSSLLSIYIEHVLYWYWSKAYHDTIMSFIAEAYLLNRPLPSFLFWSVLHHSPILALSSILDLFFIMEQWRLKVSTLVFLSMVLGTSRCFCCVVTVVCSLSVSNIDHVDLNDDHSGSRRLQNLWRYRGRGCVL